MDLKKTAKEIKARDDEAARALPVETKRTFWKAFYEDGKSIGEARIAAGIEDVSIAVALIIQCYKQICIPIEVEEIEEWKERGKWKNLSL